MAINKKSEEDFVSSSDFFRDVPHIVQIAFPIKAI